MGKRKRKNKEENRKGMWLDYKQYGSSVRKAQGCVPVACHSQARIRGVTSEERERKREREKKEKKREGKNSGGRKHHYKQPTHLSAKLFASLRFMFPFCCLLLPLLCLFPHPTQQLFIHFIQRCGFEIARFSSVDGAAAAALVLD